MIKPVAMPQGPAFIPTCPDASPVVVTLVDNQTTMRATTVTLTKPCTLHSEPNTA
ncbi:hypothetical protein ABI_17520 [Asticcacaulis biprosthecium C19]|uniref:Uncharacterized protein n=1 Tax=Asticcacaulis biprosthecium C19 TaxID=715226 RepID=F4QKD4_9CAUL|nr:hypothetical protein ABI_17520 [Asticcacaulis biprosthecium C19]